MFGTGLEDLDTATVSQNKVAEVLGVDPRLVSKAVRDGSLPTIKLGARKKILRIPLIRLLSEGSLSEFLHGK